MARDAETDLKKYPDMVRWFNPFVLFKILQGVILSAWFARYADQRVIQGASDKSDIETLNKRADLTHKDSENYKPDENGDFWIDYVSDIGDGFDSTYAVAYLLAQDTLNVKTDMPLPRGSTLIIGGDLVYPDATRENYWDRMRQPYMLAFPHDTRRQAKHPRLFAIPGNHDWYDGLAAFHGTFCRADDKSPFNGGLRIGNWLCKQHRSYFAIKLPHDWWIWGVDTQLTGYVDRPQADYFRTMAKELTPESKVIICMAVPSWVYAQNHEDQAEFRAMKYIANMAKVSDKKYGPKVSKVVAFLAGDLHHYSRYESRNKDLQLITAGGGGAFTHSTHTLKSTITIPDIRDKDTVAATFTLASHKSTPNQTETSCYPSQSTCRRLMTRNLWFPLTNLDFSIGLGVFYWIVSWFFATHEGGSMFDKWVEEAQKRDQNFLDYPITVLNTLGESPGLAMLIGVVFFALYSYADSKKLTHKILMGVTHALFHIICFLSLAIGLRILNTNIFGLDPSYFLTRIVFAGEMIFIGGILGGFIFGLYLFIMSRWFNRHAPDASSALRLNNYRNFLRLKLSKDSLTIYPIGVDKVPGRQDWVANPDAKKGRPISAFKSKMPLAPFLIEPPIKIPIDGKTEPSS